MPRLASITQISHDVLSITSPAWAAPLYRSLVSQRRRASGLWTSSIDHEARNIAILGGGITGLATAYFLSRSLPYARITLIEASSRLGGWLHSKQVDVGNGKVVFEQGPRTLRPTAPNGLITLDLVCLLIVVY